MPSIPTKGAEQLSRAGSITDLAKRLGVNARTVSAWRSGAKSPNDASRATIQRELGIPRAEWDRCGGVDAKPLTAHELTSAASAREPDWLWDHAWPALGEEHPRAFDALYRHVMSPNPEVVAAYGALVDVPPPGT